MECIELDLDSSRLRHVSAMGIKKINPQQGDANLFNFLNSPFDRVIATCLLAHLKGPESTLLEWRRVLKPGGSISIYIPCEPGIALRVFRNLFTKRKATKLGFDGHDLFIARDHLNAAERLCVLLSYAFEEDLIDFYLMLFKLKSWYIILFIVVQISKSNH